MERYITCPNCWKGQDNPPILATLDKLGVLHIRRYHKATTKIAGTNITVSCDSCGYALVVEVKKKRPTKNIMGTLSVQQEQFKYYYKQ